MYEDKNLIYTFHFYDPFLFTHQGASWTNPSMENIANIPYPYNDTTMPQLDPVYKNTWIESIYKKYKEESTIETLKSYLKKVTDFREQRKVPVYCGEFGVYMKNSNPQHRVLWYDTVRKLLEEASISWTMWDYHGGFGLFTKDSPGYFEHDLNIPLVKALGLKVPEQTPFKIQPDTVGFVLYDDILGKTVRNNPWSNSTTDFYDTRMPNNGIFCINIEQLKQYTGIVFEFAPYKDISKLVSEYSLDFMVRSDVTTSFEVRFLDTKDSAQDRPWRIAHTINVNSKNGEAVWNHVNIPLRNFKEKGSWDDNTWFNPQGQFDWTKVQRFEIVAEFKDIPGNLWFDNIHITNKDTAKVYQKDTLKITKPDTIPISIKCKKFPDDTPYVYYSKSQKTIEIITTDFEKKMCYIVDITSTQKSSYSFDKSISIPVQNLKSRIYFVHIITKNNKYSQKVLIE
ncbi:MAG: cellulase family glycosylhydrolase [Bacteroidales bacterium]